MASSSSFNPFSSSCCTCSCLISSSFLQIFMFFQTYLFHGFLFHFLSVLFLSHIYSFFSCLTCFMASFSILNLFSSSLTFILSLTVLPVPWLHLPFSICSLPLSHLFFLWLSYLFHGFFFHFESVLFFSYIYSFSYGLTCFMALSSIFNLFSSSFTFILSLMVLPISWLPFLVLICSLYLVPYVLVLSLPLDYLINIHALSNLSAS